MVSRTERKIYKVQKHNIPIQNSKQILYDSITPAPHQSNGGAGFMFSKQKNISQIKYYGDQEYLIDPNNFNRTISKEDIREYYFKKKLSLCGGFAKIRKYCKQCEDKNLPALLKTKDGKEYITKAFHCGIKYCKEPECVSYRFVEILKRFENIKEFKGLRTLQHGAIGFPDVSLYEFKNNYSRIKKRHERIMNNMFNQIRKAGVPVHGIRVTDYSFVREGRVFIHYHLGLKPFPKNKRNKCMSIFQKYKRNCHIEFFKHADINSVFKYLAVRAVGLFKYKEDHKKYYGKKQTIKQMLEEKKHFLLSDVLTPKEYLKNFFNKRCYTALGGCRYGTTITDNLRNEEEKDPVICPVHGVLERNEFRVEVEIDPPPPPDAPEPPVEVVPINFDIHLSKSGYQ